MCVCVFVLKCSCFDVGINSYIKTWFGEAVIINVAGVGPVSL